MRPATFGALLTSMLAILGAIGFAVLGRGGERPLRPEPINSNFTIQGSPYFWRGGQLYFQLSASGSQFERAHTRPLVLRFQWLDHDKRPLADASVLDWTAFYNLKHLPAHRVVESGTVAEIKRFIAGPRIPPKARFLEILLDPENLYLELDEDDNVERVRLPLPDLTLTNAQFLPDEPTLWFVLRNEGDRAAFLPVVTELTWLGPDGVIVGGPHTVAAWPGPTPLDEQRPLVQLWPDRVNVAGVKVPPVLPPPPGATSLKFEVNPAVPTDPLVVPVPEENRSNNAAMIHFVPDLTVSDPRLSTRALRFTVRTTRGPQVTGTIQMRFQWETETGATTGAPISWVFNREQRTFPRSYTFSTPAQRGLQRALFDAIPADATQLRITVNPSDGSLEFPPMLEVSTQNNSVVVPRP